MLFLDRPNAGIKPEVADLYEKLSLPVQPFESVGLYALVRREPEKMIPDSGTRSDGVLAHAWTIEEFNYGSCLPMPTARRVICPQLSIASKII